MKYRFQARFSLLEIVLGEFYDRPRRSRIATRLIVAISPIDASAVSNTVATVWIEPQTTIASVAMRKKTSIEI